MELLISMAIVAILSAVMFQMARQSDTQSGLIISRDRLRSALRAAQSFALTIPKGGITEAHVCGFGVWVSSTDHYQVFYNASDDIADCANADHQTYSAASQFLEGYDFSNEENTQFADSELDVDGAGTHKSIFFAAPYAEVYNWAGQKLVGTVGYQSDVHFLIQKTDGSAALDIKVTPFGSIE